MNQPENSDVFHVNSAQDNPGSNSQVLNTERNLVEEGRGTTEETEYRPEEGLSPTAWRNLKIILVVGGIVGNLIMRYGLVD